MPQKEPNKSVEQIDTLVIGGGQAGIAMSEHLGKAGISHLVLERARIAERWRSERWDSLMANGPAWHDRFPNRDFNAHKPDAFVSKEEIADYLVDYATQVGCPIRENTEVTSLSRKETGVGFVAKTSVGEISARYVVSATGPFQRPLIPQIVPKSAGVKQIHSVDYHNPEELPKGAVLVVGSGSSGVQIAAELLAASRKVYLSVGKHDRPPRRYRGRDFVWWLGVLNLWDAEFTPGTEHTTIAVTGSKGGYTIDFRNLAESGATLVGRTNGFDAGKISFAGDLINSIQNGDMNYLATLDMADAFIERNGIDLPEEPEARKIGPDPDCITNPLVDLDLADAGVSTILWATGYGYDYDWLDVDACDENGKPAHTRGVSTEPGFYYLGLPWLSRRGSSFLWGVWHDAKFIADHIAKQEGYLAYQGLAERLTDTG